MNKKLKLILSSLFIISILTIGLAYAVTKNGLLAVVSSPSISTYHSLDDIYNLIVSNTTKANPNSPTSTSTTPTSTTTQHSTSEIYALLANMKTNVVSSIHSSSTPLTNAGVVQGYTLDDIWGIAHNSSYTPSAHSFGTTPTASMHTTSEIYDYLNTTYRASLVTTPVGNKIKYGQVRFGITGTFGGPPVAGYPITECMTLSTSTTYSLQNDIPTAGDCLIVAADNVIIEGNGFTVAGNVVGENGVDQAGKSIDIRNIVVSGSVTAGDGGNDGPGFMGFPGGNISITNSMTGAVNGGISVCLGGDSGNGGPNGSITILSSITGNVTSPVQAECDYGYEGGAGGNITIATSTVGSVVSNGSVGKGDYEGGVGGAISITNSTTTGNVISNGGDTYTAVGGAGGEITITRSNIGGLVKSRGGNEDNSWYIGGVGGDITVIDSDITGEVSSIGGSGFDGAQAGTISISNSSNTGDVYSTGGDGNTGGTGGNVTVDHSVVGTITANGGRDTELDLDTNTGAGGNAGNITIIHSIAETITANGGDVADYGPRAGSGGNIIVEDSSTVNGDLITKGGNSVDGNAYTGGSISSSGSISVYNSTVSGSLTLNGGNSDNGIGGFAGEIVVSTSTVGSIVSVGGYGTWNYGGRTGTTTLRNSHIGDISFSGGYGISLGGGVDMVSIDKSTVGDITLTSGSGDSSGDIVGLNIINGSDIGLISVSSGSVEYAHAGQIGSININNSVINGLNSSMGQTCDIAYGMDLVEIKNSTSTGDIALSGSLGFCFSGGTSGNLKISTSTVLGGISSEGGDGSNGNGGNTGTIEITNSTITDTIISTAGYSGQAFGASVGSITITNSSILSISAVSTGNCSSSDQPGVVGDITINNPTGPITSIVAKGGDSCVLDDYSGGNGGNVIFNLNGVPTCPTPVPSVDVSGGAGLTPGNPGTITPASCHNP